MLQEDKNVTIDDVLNEEDVRRQLSGQQIAPKDIEQQVIERL
jgi:hypothetical protein